MRKKRLFAGVLILLLFIGFTYLVSVFDVREVGEQSVTVGFALINRLFNSLLGYNETLYKLSDYFGYMAFIVCAVYGVIGLIQLITRKDVQKVDREILLLGFLYVVTLFIKIIFDKFIVINVRPFAIDGVFEPSYPSSHTFMAMIICGSSIILNKKKYDNSFIARICNYLVFALMIIIVATRFLSGVHWFSDIVGSMILSLGLLLIYSGFITSKE